MDYELLIFSDKDTLSVYNVRDKAYCSMDGEESLNYRDSSDVEEFTSKVVGSCGGKSFSDYDFSVVVINLGADLEVLFQLHKLLKGCKEINILNVEKILPLVALNLGLGKNETRVYTFGDLAWQVTSHAEDKTITVQEVETAGGEELTPEDFGLLYEFRTIMQSDVEEIARIKAEYEGKDKQRELELAKQKQDCDRIVAETQDIDNLVKDMNYKKKLLSRFTDDLKILNHPELVACTQDELDALLQKKEHTIYLFYKQLILTNPEDVRNVTLFGVVKAIVRIPATTFINFERNGITFENVRFDEEYRKVFAKYYKKPGETVKLGKWQGKDIEWQVLEVKDGKALIITKELIAQKAFDENGSNSWKSSSLRQWLNGEFYRKIFDKMPRGTVEDTKLNDVGTTDKLYLLSKNEAENYFRNDSKRVLNNTGVFVFGNGAVLWWLRSPYDSFFHDVYNVSTDGSIHVNLRNCDLGSVRPACWVNLESEIFYS